MRHNRYKFSLWLLLAAGWVAVVSVALARSGSVFDQLDLLIDIRHEIVNGYVEEADQQKMIEAAVYGMIESLDDPHTTYVSTDDLSMFEEQVTGRFTGIGAEVTIDDKLQRLRIVTPLEDSPAWHAGVLPGDIILEIDGKSMADITHVRHLRKAVKMLKGLKDTQVVVKVRHESGQEQDITITRAVINVKSVRGFRRGEDNRWLYMLDPQRRIAYARISQFTDRTTDELSEVLKDLEEQQIRGLILDLRFNPGGLLSAAVAVSDMFLDGEKAIVSVRGRKFKEEQYKSKSQGTFAAVPIVVLANERSASAAEIVTGALTDHGRAKFVGMRTYGKGSVQSSRLLEGGSMIKLTRAYYYLPSGRLIHRRDDSDLWGVDPEDGFFVPMTFEQTRKMVDTRVKNAQNRNLQEVDVTPQWIEQSLADLQLAAGLRAMIGKLDDDQWPVVGQSGAKLVQREVRRTELLRRRDLISDTLAEVERELVELDTPDTSVESADDVATSEPDKPASISDAPADTDEQPVDTAP